jgi:predicted DNA-binding transcriptional regulator YafY
VNQPLNEQEAQILKESLLTLSRFRGMPQFEWVEELTARLEQTFSLKSDKKVIGFEENPFLEGLEHLKVLYNAIINQQVLQIGYQPFGKERKHFDLHPYYLKQYNNRWFLFGFNEKYEKLTNLAIDRIVSLKQVNKEYVINTKIDFEDYFYDTVGVTVKNDETPQKIIFRVSKELFPYIESKPIHGSQKIRTTNDGDIMVELLVHINYELTSQLFNFMDGIEILEPTDYRKQFENILRKTLEKYL